MNFMCRLFLYFSIVNVILIFFGGDSKLSGADKKPVALEVKMDTKDDKISGGETFEVKIYRETSAPEELAFKVGSDNSQLISLDSAIVKILANERSAVFKVKTTSTLIKTSVTLKAVLEYENTSIRVERTVEIVPARLKSVSFSSFSMIGTHGSKVECTVSLQAPAPAGGIELYISSPSVATLSDWESFLFQFSNPRVSAGSNKATFEIKYDEIRNQSGPISHFETKTNFNSQKRSVEFVVALDPQQIGPTGQQWQTIPGFAHKTKFDVVPLQVSSISVQPSTMTGGNEAIGNFTLSAAPGNNESIFFRPNRSETTKVWVKPLGSSCQELDFENYEFIEIPLAQGVTNHSFKVCTASVTTSRQMNIAAHLRSGDKTTIVTVQP